MSQRPACAGAILVKAAVLMSVERLHAAGIGKMYSGWPQTWAQVGFGACIVMTCARCQEVHQAAEVRASTVHPAAETPAGRVFVFTACFYCLNLLLQWGYILLTIVALDYLHDTWFYWTHRLLHWKPLYRHVHYLHHR